MPMDEHYGMAWPMGRVRGKPHCVIPHCMLEIEMGFSEGFACPSVYYMCSEGAVGCA